MLSVSIVEVGPDSVSSRHEIQQISVPGASIAGRSRSIAAASGRVPHGEVAITRNDGECRYMMIHDDTL